MTMHNRKLRKESDLESAFRDLVKQIGGMCRKYYNPQDTGWPDRDVLLPDGTVWFVEVKKPGSTLDPVQKIRKKWLEDHKFNYYLLDSWEAFHKFKNTVLHKWNT